MVRGPLSVVRSQRPKNIVQWEYRAKLSGPDFGSLKTSEVYPTGHRLMSLAANPRSLVFFMAYPGPGNLDGASRSLIETRYLMSGLDRVLENDSFQYLELTSLKPKQQQKEIARKLKGGGKRVAFHCSPVQWTNEESLIDPADLSCASEVHRRRAVDRIIRLMDEAAGYGAEQIFIASGRNPASGMP